MISVIIPALNEARNIRGTIAAVKRCGTAHEILVADGGSEDGTRELARAEGAKVIECERRGRAAQLNCGAAEAAGEILLFLHADTIVPAAAFANIESALANPEIGGGAFARRFDSLSRLLRLTCLLAEVRNRTIGWHLGDQAMFTRKNLFEELGGFHLLDRFEDLDFSRRLGRKARLVTLRPPVISSARRFTKAGPMRGTMRDLVLTVRYLWGDPAAVHAPPAVEVGRENAH